MVVEPSVGLLPLILIIDMVVWLIELSILGVLLHHTLLRQLEPGNQEGHLRKGRRLPTLQRGRDFAVLLVKGLVLVTLSGLKLLTLQLTFGKAS